MTDTAVALGKAKNAIIDQACCIICAWTPTIVDYGAVCCWCGGVNTMFVSKVVLERELCLRMNMILDRRACFFISNIERDVNHSWPKPTNHMTQQSYSKRLIHRVGRSWSNLAMAAKLCAWNPGKDWILDNELEIILWLFTDIYIVIPNYLIAAFGFQKVIS